MVSLLSSRTPVPPDVPRARHAGPPPHLPDVGRRDALVVAVVPLADVVRDLHVGRARRVVLADALGGAVPVPRQGLAVLADAEELKGALGALPGGDVAVPGLVRSSSCWGCDIEQRVWCEGERGG